MSNVLHYILLIMVYTVNGMQASVFLQKSFLLPSLLLLVKVSSLFHWISCYIPPLSSQTACTSCIARF